MSENVSSIDQCNFSYNVFLQNPKVVGSLVPLGLICLIVTFGNILVITAVKISSKLSGPTYTIIVSLAVADLLLGVLVLPLSAVYEVVDSWIFGKHLCFMWLSVDVWTCTSSILHLVIISMDRYIAVTHPVTYPNIMTGKRTKMLISLVWVISFIICFPPLIGWGAEPAGQSEAPGTLNLSSTAALASLGVHMSEPETEMELEAHSGWVLKEVCRPQCILPKDPGYVLYSAIGSFFAPMMVMIFFNWRIYRVASKTTQAIRRGFTKVRGEGGNSGSLMGIHRGKTLVKKLHQSEIALSTRDSGADRNALYGFSSTRNSLDLCHQREKDNESLLQVSNPPGAVSSLALYRVETSASPCLLTGNGHVSSSESRVASRYTCNLHQHKFFAEQGTQTVKTSTRTKSKRSLMNLNRPSLKLGQSRSRLRLSLPRQSSLAVTQRQNSTDTNTSGGSGLGAGRSSPVTDTDSFKKSETSFTKRNIKSQVRKFKMETKAAKTIGIIVGCFVLCWLPFFSIYITRAACTNCVPDLLFSVFFWLGYCNSAINPVIYGLFSREFRAAFKKIICKFFCKAYK